jgi:integrase
MRGNITRRAKSWQIKFDVQSVNGKRQQRYATVRGTYKDAQRELTRLLNAADEGNLPDPSNSTLADYLSSWLDGLHGLSPKTLERYRELSERQIIPHLGATKLQRLKPEHVQQWHGSLIASGLSARTVGHAHRVLRLVLQCAVKNRTVPRNVASIHSPPKVETGEVEILSADQIADVLAKLDGHALYPIVALALATGMRRGELLGLQWGDIDLDAATLRVERSVEETKAGLRVKPPKTKRGRRSITLPAEAVSMLRAHKIEALEIRLALSMGNITPSTLVFGTVEGELIRPRNLTKAWWRARSALELPPVSFHAFRHSHASMLIRAGVDVLTVSRRLGHTQASTTLDVYGHLLDGADAAAAKAISGILGTPRER